MFVLDPAVMDVKDVLEFYLVLVCSAIETGSDCGGRISALWTSEWLVY